ncbi:MAG: ribosome maturation factor RimP [Deltaproteobacteria bacterium]|nr:ribosome maturation factor RimP [Deltaproteobacteria bacterium]NIS76575.1 ribosome maturation factor RimP [Deltaproteobacteria bacterium]
MRAKEIKKRVVDLAEDIALQECVEVVDVEMSGNPGRYIVRVFIDRDGGVTIADCESFSRNLGALMEIDDPIPTSYYLEVSSPGIERVLRKPSHFKRFVGETVNVRLENPIGGRRKISGTITEVTESYVVIGQEGERIVIDYKNVKKARLKKDVSELT